MTPEPHLQAPSEQHYVFFELEEGGRELHDGPYDKPEAVMVAAGLTTAIETGRETEWVIPTDAVGAATVPSDDVHGDRPRPTPPSN